MCAFVFFFLCHPCVVYFAHTNQLLLLQLPHTKTRHRKINIHIIKYIYIIYVYIVCYLFSFLFFFIFSFFFCNEIGMTALLLCTRSKLRQQRKLRKPLFRYKTLYRKTDDFFVVVFFLNFYNLFCSISFSCSIGLTFHVFMHNLRSLSMSTIVFFPPIFIQI